MFLAAFTRPRFDTEGVWTFDGKIGMFHFIERVAAQRTSMNREKGVIETKLLPVNKNRYREFMIEKVVAAIKDKWPDRGWNIVIQQDGASAHIDEFDPAFVPRLRRELEYYTDGTITQIARLECSWPFFSGLAIKMEQRVCEDNWWAYWFTDVSFWWVWCNDFEFWMDHFDDVLWRCDYLPWR